MKIIKGLLGILYLPIWAIVARVRQPRKMNRLGLPPIGDYVCPYDGKTSCLMAHAGGCMDNIESPRECEHLRRVQP